MNLNIVGLKGTANYLFWRLDNYLEGACYVKNGVVETPILRDDTHIELRPSSSKEIHEQCQKWIDEMPKREKENQEWLARYDYYDRLWETWRAHEEIEGLTYRAIPSIYHEPDEIAVQGECRFIAYDEGGNLWRSQLHHNPTWANVMREFEWSMEFTDDFHHCFLEGIEKSEFQNEYYFVTGS